VDRAGARLSVQRGAAAANREVRKADRATPSFARGLEDQAIEVLETDRWLRRLADLHGQWKRGAGAGKGHAKKPPDRNYSAIRLNPRFEQSGSVVLGKGGSF